jgi:hypothetical protein
MTFRSSLALTQRCSTGFPLVQMFREVPARRWFWVGLVGPGATNHCPRLPRTRLLGGGPHLCQCMPSKDELVVTYRTPRRAALGRTKEQVCTASAPMALGAAVTGGVSDRKDMLSCLYRKAVGWQNPH